MKKRILVTSALPYANGPIHVGHLAGAYLPADVYVRYQRLKGRDVLYICGNDEHGVPITLRALAEGVSPRDIVDRYYDNIHDSFRRFGMSFDHYSGTSRAVHHRQAQEFFLRLHEQGMLVQKTEQQLYCEHDQMFLADRYVEGTCPHEDCGFPQAKGDQCEKCGRAMDPLELVQPRCVLCRHKPVVRDTTHWYFPLGRFQDRLQAWLASKTHWKENVLKFCQGYFESGLQDRAVTRDLNWGVPVPLPDAEGKVLYVWFDAPIGYISATIEWAERIGQPDQWKEYWCDAGTKLVHFIGKDNIFFHALLFPAMCMAHGDYVLAEEVPANEFLNLEGQKISTSRNWAVWLPDYLEKFDPDSLRYYLACIAPETNDSDFSWKDFQARHNNELADALGNFVQRSLKFAQNYFDGRVPPAGEPDATTRELRARLAAAPAEIGDLLENFELRKAVRAGMDLAHAGNVYFQSQEPWRTRRADPARCATTINTCVQVCKTLAVLMSPVLPFAADRLARMLNLDGQATEQRWEEAAVPLPDGHPLNPPEILFPKLEDEAIEAELQKLRQAAPRPESEETKVDTDLISMEEFARMDLRVARVETCERVKGTDRLLKMGITLGDEPRQIVAGLAHLYQPEDLIGKLIVVVANLQPAKLRGIESQGMLLAAQDGPQVVILTPEKEIAPGAKVK